MLIHRSSEVIFKLFLIKNDVAVVIYIKCAQYVIKFEILSSDLSLASETHSVRFAVPRAGQLTQVVNQVPQQVLCEQRIILKASVSIPFIALE